MPGFDGTGPAGMGPMTGGGRGLCSPVGPGVRGYGGRGVYGGGRGGAYRGRARWQSMTPYAMPYSPRLTREEEIDYLRSEADTIKSQLEEIELRIKGLAGAS